MKVKLIIPALLISLLAFSGCGSSKSKARPKESQSQAFTPNDAISDSIVSRELLPSSAVDDLAKISGTLNYSGSEPFLFPTLFESDSSSYRLIGDEKFITETFGQLNGKKVTIYGKVQQRGTSRIIEVHYYKIGEEHE